MLTVFPDFSNSLSYFLSRLIALSRAFPPFIHNITIMKLTRVDVERREREEDRCETGTNRIWRRMGRCSGAPRSQIRWKSHNFVSPKQTSDLKAESISPFYIFFRLLLQRSANPNPKNNSFEAKIWYFCVCSRNFHHHFFFSFSLLAWLSSSSFRRGMRNKLW